MSLCCEKNGAIWGKKTGHLVHQICIWSQHMANPGHLTITLIRMCRQAGCRALTVSVSFFSQHADLALIIRTFWANEFLRFFHFDFLLKFPPLLCSLSIGRFLSNSQDGLTLWVPLKLFTNHKRWRQQLTVFSGGWGKKCKFYFS
jgi:hypothetical protein